MIIVMKPNAALKSIESVVSYIENNGLQTHLSKGEEVTIIGIVGDKTKLPTENLISFKDVDRIVPVTESYKLANRKFHPDPSVVKVGNTLIGPDNMTIMAGPCAVETEEQLMCIARAVKKSGATILRGGAYKPRTSPYSFQGLEEEGLRYMQTAKKETGLSTICEVVSNEAIEAAVKYVDMIQIGARNMQNFILLKEAGRSGLPVLLKRGLCATIDEWLNAAEYIIAEGNPNVVLCERGIRTFETATRNTLDLSAVPVLKERTHLPVIADPSHSTGAYKYVPPMAKAAVACGADGLMIEVHDNPACALSDGPQSLTFEKFDKLTKELKPLCDLVGREFTGIIL
ncbi:3-deoxy-D-arabinoheptulosonate-7-phosphate synthase [Kineothrix alysoides]|uniref:3-deoxy-D-arabinoheptulosonate-7-phosphate synthase n=1 Tax=Kineothrix alysoides TaxID=1469948 RepID=A0A4R1R3D5_9FIRM|nr:3-deoxy-7-phosphoheptulonate synthase [Kineothrix alysoides]TCL59925.1 3-deoxy-D-arabinoheptulosonate-7-phosphate synthase [Kineothrix alysoides]